MTSTQVIAERVRQLMKRKDWTAQRLVDELAKVGIEWTRLIVANLLVKKSDRRRRYVTVDELLALAKVLDVAPIDLMLPVDLAARYAITPTTAVQASVARSWIRGQIPLHGQDARIFHSEGPWFGAPTHTNPQLLTDEPA
jgi:hypothetical protein